MKKKGLFFFVLAAVFSTILFVNGCSVFKYESQQTAGSETFYEGRLDSRIERPISDVRSAAVAAYKNFGIGISKAVNDRLSGVVLGKLASGDAVVTELSSISEGKTEVSIKVGGDGNIYISRRILKAIKENLNLAPDNS